MGPWNEKKILSLHSYSYTDKNAALGINMLSAFMSQINILNHRLIFMELGNNIVPL